MQNLRISEVEFFRFLYLKIWNANDVPNGFKNWASLLKREVVSLKQDKIMNVQNMIKIHFIGGAYLQ